MRKLRALWMRFCGLLHKPQGESDFEAEIASHLAMHIDDGIRAGLSSEEARRQALIRLGGAEQTRQAYRERRGLPWLETLVRDLFLQPAAADQTPGNCNHRRAFDRPGYRRQRHHLLHGQPIRSASRAGRRSIHLVGHPEARRKFAFMATVQRSSRTSEIFLRSCGLLSAGACLHRRPRRTGTGVGPGGHGKFLRCRRTSHDARSRFREQRRQAACGRAGRRPMASPLPRRPRNCGRDSHSLGPNLYRGGRRPGRLPRD